MLESVYQYIHKFVDLNPAELDVLSKLLQIRHFEKKVQLVSIGEHEQFINFVHKGVIRKFFYRDKEEVITQIAKENDLICSSVSFLSGVPSDYIVETIETSTVVSLSRDNMEQLYAMGPKMERMGRLIIIDWLIRKENWEFSRVQLGPKARFLEFIGSNPNLLQRVPQKYLASYLNIKPETFSRYKHLIH